MATKKSVGKTEVEQINIEEIKREVLDYAERKIDLEVEQAVKKAEKKLINQKNIIIIKRNIIIILLLIIIMYLSSLLYRNGYFNKYIVKDAEIIETTPQEEIKEEAVSEENPQEKLLDKYKYLLNKIQISEKSKYLEDYYNGELTKELKLYLSTNNLEKSKIVNEETTYIIEKEELVSMCEELFGKNTCELASFDFNKLTFRYLKTQDIYIAEGKMETTKSNIIKLPILVEENDNEVTISTVEAIITNNKLYNVKTNKEIGIYKDETSITKNETKLTKMKYTFICNDEDCHLTKIEENQ